jgi:hypothetical protein
MLSDGLVRGQQFKVDHSFDIPPYAEHNLARMKSRFRGWNWSLTRVKPLMFSCKIDVEDPFLITSHNPVQEWVGVQFKEKVSCEASILLLF